MESLVLSVCCRLLLGVQSRVGCQRQFLMMLQHLLILHRNYHQCVRGKDGFQKMATFLSLFIFSVLTSFSFKINFSCQIKSLFIFRVLTSFFLNFIFCVKSSLFIFSVLTSFTQDNPEFQKGQETYLFDFDSDPIRHGIIVKDE